MRMYFCLGKYQLHVNQSPCMLQRCSGGLRGLKLFYSRSCEFPVSEADKMDDTGDYFSGVEKTKLERLGKIWGPECSKN